MPSRNDSPENAKTETANLHNITVTFRHTEPTPALKTHAIDKISHVTGKYLRDIAADVQIILSVEKRDQMAEVNLKAKEFEASSKAVTDDLYSAIDKVADTLESQIRKQKERLRSHKHNSARAADFTS